MTEGILIFLVSVLCFVIGVIQTKLAMKNDETDSVHRANRARDSVVSGDESAISADFFNRDNRK